MIYPEIKKKHSPRNQKHNTHKNSNTTMFCVTLLANDPKQDSEKVLNLKIYLNIHIHKGFTQMYEHGHNPTFTGDLRGIVWQHWSLCTSHYGGY